MISDKLGSMTGALHVWVYVAKLAFGLPHLRVLAGVGAASREGGSVRDMFLS
jgi:hypothetical protein